MVAIPDPSDRLPDTMGPIPPVALPEICLVTGRRDGVRLQPVPQRTWTTGDPVLLPVTDQGLGEVVQRTRIAQVLVVGSVIATFASMSGLQLVLPWVGNGRYLSLVLFVIGVLVARTLRHRTLHTLSVRNGVRVLFVPVAAAADAVRDAVRRADLPVDFRRQLESAEKLAALNEGNHPLAD